MGAPARLTSRHAQLPVVTRYPHTSNVGFVARSFSSKGNDDFRETLEKMKNKASETKEEGDTKEDGEENSSKSAETPPPPDFDKTVRKVSDYATDAYVSIKDNLRMAWDDLTGASKQTTLRKSVMQAESFRRGGETRPEGEDEAEKYDGPTALVWVKDQGSAWDKMKARLSSSPLIREMLKNTKKATQAAAQTDIGKKAFETGQSVKDKVDVR